MEHLRSKAATNSRTHTGSANRLSVLAMAGFLAAFGPAGPVSAQETGVAEALESEIDPEVKTTEAAAEARTDSLVEAIAGAPESAVRVATVYELDELRIVFVPELGEGGGRADAALAEHKDAIAEMRSAIQGNAMFYHALDDRQILLDNVIAVQFADDDAVTVFVAGTDPGGQAD